MESLKKEKIKSKIDASFQKLTSQSQKWKTQDKAIIGKKQEAFRGKTSFG